MNYKLIVEKTVVVKEEETLTLAQYVGRRLTMFRESAGLNVSALHRLTLASSLPQRGEVPGISHSSIASIEKIEPYLNKEQFQEYCDSAYTMIAYWAKQAKLCSDGS